MFDRRRLAQFSPKDFLEEPKDFEIFEQAQRTQRIGALLATMREAAGLSILDMGQLAGADAGYIERIERGQLLTTPPRELCIRIAGICLDQIAGVKAVA